MEKTSKQVAKIFERQHMKKVKNFYRLIMNINMELANIHRKIEFDVDKDRYKHATEYVNQYISFTSVWNLKFVHNYEDPEVALLQIFHLEFIFNNEPKNKLKQERKLFDEQCKAFLGLNIYSEEHIQLRKKKMIDYINEQNKKMIT